MKLTAGQKLILILLLTLVASYISLPKRIPVNIHLGPVNFERTFEKPTIGKDHELVLGLDLAGGSHLVFEVDTADISKEKKETALTSLRNVIERRVNLFGVSEPNVQTSSFEDKDRIIVELPGVKDTEEAKSIIGKTAQLVFSELSEEEGGGLIPTQLTGAYLKDANVVFDRNVGKPAVSIEFTSEGATLFADITKRNINKPLAIVLDGEPVSAPIVQDQIVGGSAQITGEFTQEQAKNLAIQLNAGALPLNIELIEERTVGATLGGESVERSIKAGLVGLLMVLLFMILAYGKLGFYADLALVVFGVVTLALYKLIPIVLTLPGIAGFLLSVGMAVDSNILIFERFKEEKKKRDYANALEISFGRAWDSIRDANIATLVTAFILANPLDLPFLHTSGPVRGFAITLALGIGISLFTGIVVSRNLLRVFVKEGKEKKEKEGKK